jgi:hypothetical protein
MSIQVHASRGHQQRHVQSPLALNKCHLLALLSQPNSTPSEHGKQEGECSVNAPSASLFWLH